MDLSATLCLFVRTLPIDFAFYWDGNGNGYPKIKDDRKIKRETNLDRHSLRPIPNVCHLPEPPWFSLQTTFLYWKREFFCVTLLHLPPLRFHCFGGCWDWTQDCCDIGHRPSDALTTRLNASTTQRKLIHKLIHFENFEFFFINDKDPEP